MSLTMSLTDINVTMSTFADNSTLNMRENSTQNYYTYYLEALAFEHIVGIVIPTIYAVIIFVGVLGNTLVITVVALNRQMRNSTNMLIINLALADLLFLVFCVPFTAADSAMPTWDFAWSWCSCLFYFQFVTAYGSVWTLVLMAFDRFLAVVFPVQSITLRTVRNTILTAAAVWMIIFTANIPQLESHGILEYRWFNEERQSCSFIAMANRTATPSEVQLHFFTFIIFGYFVPLIITCFFYLFMLIKLWFRMPMGSRIRGSEESVRAKRRVTWMVTSVIVTFAICWLPLNICFAYNSLLYTKEKGPPGSKELFIVTTGAQVLAYMNSCLNPILYAFLSENFRKGFYRILSCITTGKRLGARDYDFERTESRFPTENTLNNNRLTSVHRSNCHSIKFTDKVNVGKGGEMKALKNGTDVCSNIEESSFD